MPAAPHPLATCLRDFTHCTNWWLKTDSVEAGHDCVQIDKGSCRAEINPMRGFAWVTARGTTLALWVVNVNVHGTLA